MKIQFLSGDPGFGTVWVCGYVSLRAVGESIHHGSSRSRCSGSVKIHLRSVSNTIQWAFLTVLCKYSDIDPLFVATCNKFMDLLRIHPTLSFMCMQTLVDVCAQLPNTHLPTLLVSGVSLIILIIAKELNNRYREKLPVPIPVELIIVSFFFFFSYSIINISLFMNSVCIQSIF